MQRHPGVGPIGVASNRELTSAAAQLRRLQTGVPKLRRQETATLTTRDKLRLEPETATVPVVICTPDPRGRDGLVGRAAEGLFVLARPFDLDRLLPIHAAAPRRRS